jgi:hypothetical protein
MPVALRWSVVSLLGLLGLAGLVQLPLAPPLAMRTGADTDQVLADLANQEADQEKAERATQLLSRFVGGEITRYFWGGFTGYLDVLGLEPPPDMETRLSEAPDMVQLLLVPRHGDRRFVARVQAVDNVPRGVACSGVGEPGRFSLEANLLQCPAGWIPLRLSGQPRQR